MRDYICEPKKLETPLVSVVITAYNRADTIERAVAGVLCQTTRNLEVLVVDDASTDRTAAVVKDIVDPRVRLIRNAENQGIGGAKNVGVRASKGRYIAFLDSDDEWLPEKLERQLEVLQADPAGPPVCFTAFWVHRMETGRVVVRRPRKYNTWLNSILMGETFSLGSTFVGDRRCFNEVGLLDVSLRRLQDRDWTLRYLERYPEFHFIDEPLVRVYNSGWPSPQLVQRSTDALYAANKQRLQTLAPTAASQFRASLTFEVAVANYRSGNIFQALRHLGRAVVQSPTGAGYIASRVWRKIREFDLR